MPFGSFYELSINAALFFVLIYVIGDDLRRYRIRNDVIVLLLVLFGLLCLLKFDWDFVKAHLAFGAIAFVGLFAFWALGLTGGGDAKLLAVALLWLGHSQALAFSVVMLVFTLLYYIGVKAKIAPHSSVNGKTVIPYGPSIASAWILTVLAYGLGGL
jgi:Flp pilus assembly protein protease CpaA